MMAFAASLVVAVWAVETVYAACYTPDGQDRNTLWDAQNGVSSTPYQPLDPDAPASMCCASWDTRAPSPYNPALCIGSDGALWRESCTDRSWRSPECLKLCADGPSTGGDRVVTSCSDGSYCCDGGNFTCCDANEGYFVEGEMVLPAMASGMATATTASSKSSTIPTTVTPPTNGKTTGTTSPTSARMTTTTTSPSGRTLPHRGLSGGAIAGMVIGIVAAAAVALSVAVTLLRRKRPWDSRSPQRELTQGDHREIVETSPLELDAAGKVAHEKDGASVYKLADAEAERR